MKKQFLGLLIVISLLVTLFPTAANAATSYNIWVGGTQVTSGNAANILGNNTASYNNSTNTLTLNNANISGWYSEQDDEWAWYGYGIYSQYALNIILEGNNTVDISSASGSYLFGVKSEVSVTIGGSGSFTVQVPEATWSSSYGICSEGSVTINSGTISATSLGTAIFGASININGGTIEATGTTRAFNQVPNFVGYTANKSIMVGASSPGTVWDNSTALNSYKYVKIAPVTNYTATVTVHKDGSLWTSSPPDIKLSTSPFTLTGAISGALSNGVYTFSELANESTYYVFAGEVYTGQIVTKTSNTATVNYYTITFRNANNSGTLDAQIVLSGQTAIYGGTTPTKSQTAQYIYTFSNWVTMHGGETEATLTNITAQKTVYPGFTQTLRSYTITWKADASTTIGTTTVDYGVTPTYSTPTKTGYTFSAWTPAIASVTGDTAYTASWTLDTYGISYTLNGGTVTPANPANYTFESSAITLNNPTRDGYSFVGWSGTGLTGTTNQTVTISTGSTGEKSYTANWKANTPAAPEASIVTARTDTSLAITTQPGYEYSVNGATWYSGTEVSYTFTGLTAGISYNLVCRKAAVTSGDTSEASDASPALAVSTKYAAPAAPLLSITSASQNLIIVGYVEGAEYSKDNGVTWQPGNGFNGLTPATLYIFAIRIKETDDTVAGIKASRTQYTAAATPAAGEGYSFSYSTERITISSGYQVSTNSNFFMGTLIDNDSTINPGATYYVRVAASGGVPASDRAEFTIPARPTAPSAMAVSKTANSITITPISGQEYKINSDSWQESGSFIGLSPNTEYSVYARVKATVATFASENYYMSVTTKSVGSVTVPTPDPITYDPAKTLADITLPANWAWSADETIPTVAISSYNGVYTPMDTDTVDYSGVTGYAVDGSGNVTITKTVSLTVNRATPTAADFTYTAPASLDYSGTAKTAVVTANDGIIGMGAVTFKYYLGSVETSPTNSGTYTVKIDLAQGGNYAAATDITDSAWTFTIANVAQAPLSITNKPASVTYGDTFTLATTGGSGTGAVTWSVTVGDSATVNLNTGAVTITGVNETTITATKAADINYTDAVTDTYTFTPAKLQLNIALPSAADGWTKTYDASTEFDKAAITVGGMTNKVGLDDVTVSVASATYDTADIGVGNKELTIIYEIEGTDSGNYSAPANIVIPTSSITAATPTVDLVAKTSAYTGSIIEIAAAAVIGIGAENDITPNYDGAVTYTYYIKDTCTDADRTTVENSGAEAIGGAPKNAGTYYVKATIAANGNYAEAVSTVVTLTIYYPSSGQNNAGAPVIVDGKSVDMGTTQVKDENTTIVVDQSKMSEQLKNAMDSVVIPITSKTDSASAQLVVENVESMSQRGVSLTVIAGDVSYSIPSGAIDTSAALKALGASDSSKVPFNITISKLPNSSVTIQKGTLMVPPVAFTITATYNGKSVAVERFASYVQRVIEIPAGTDPQSITTAVVVAADGTQRHVPTLVYADNGKWYARINTLTNSTYALIQNSVSFTDTKGKWYDASVTEMASREIISGIGKNMFAGERAITRAEFAAIIVRALGLPTDSIAAEAFNDVPANQWYYGAVGTAYEYGLVTGKGKGLFDPTGNITRQEAMAMVARGAKLAGYEGKEDNISGFSDVDKIGAWAFNAVKFNVGSGLIVGSNGQLRPADEISRAETATVILRLLRNSQLIDARK